MKRILLLVSLFFFSFSTYAKSVYEVDGNNVTINLEGIGSKSKLLKIEVWTSSVIRVVSTMNDTFSETPSLIGNRPAEEVKFKVAYAQSNIEIATSNMIIHVAEDGMVRMLNKKGRKLLVESNRTYEANEDGTYQTTQRFFLNRGEHIYGFGQQDLNTSFNLRNREFALEQTPTNIAAPVFFSERGFAFIWDNYSATHLLDKPSGFTLSSDIADEISYLVVNGPDWNTLVSEIRSISGEALLLPKWAYGYHLHAAAYGSDQSKNQAIKQYEDLGLFIEKQMVDNSFCKKELELTTNNNEPAFKNIAAYRVLKDDYETAQKEAGNKRIITPTHSNFMGIQQYSTYTKAGMISSCWKSLKSQVSAGIVSGFTGQPHWSTTIGGMKENSSCPIENKDELITRWFQFAALTPIFQGSPSGFEAWDSQNNGIKNAIKMRYMLMPYIYTSAYHAVNDQKNIINSLLFNYQEDEATHELGLQYMFGSSLMVCPVTDNEVKTIPIHLPSGATWVDFWSGKSYEGGTNIKADVSIENIPVYVKHGSIIPIQRDSTMEIRIYAGADANFKLFEDEGDGFGYKQEEFSIIEFSYTEKNRTLQISSIEGNYPNMITDRVFNIVIVSEEDGFGLEDAITFKTVEYEGKKEKIKF